MKSLSVGDVVSTAVQIYRSHFKSYATIALIGSLWSFIPVFGWAKFTEILGRISRLAFLELSQQPESPETAMKITDPLKWRFLMANIIVSLYYFVAVLVYVIVFAIIIGVLAAAVPPLAIAIGVLSVIAGLILLIRLSCRLFVFDTALAVEKSATASAAVQRSMNLSQGSVGRIQWVVVISMIIVTVCTLPLQGLRVYLQIGSGIDPSLGALLRLFLLVMGILVNAAILPFWQVVKAVIYFDLRTRREGLGLQLRNQ